MLKTTRKMIVGMMNRLRMAISLKPRLAEAEPGSSLANIENSSVCNGRYAVIAVAWHFKTGKALSPPRP
jgi:hypothetical protein